MGPVVLDSSVVIGFLDSDDPHHDIVVPELSRLREASLIVSVITYAEVMVGAVRAGPSARHRAEGFWRDVPEAIEPVGRQIGLFAAELRARHRSLTLPDALIIGTGEVLEAAAILTADARLSGCSRRIRVLAA